MTPPTLITGLLRRLRTQIVREHHGLSLARIDWPRRAARGAINGLSGGLSAARRPSARHEDPLEQLWARPARVPPSRRS